MKQVFILHGGESFDSYASYFESLKAKTVDYERLKYSQNWREWIANDLSDYDVLLPSLPNKNNAVYEEWVVSFEKLIPLFSDDVQLVGHSLGATFLAKYLNEIPLPTPVRRLILVAPVYDDDSSEELGSFKLESARDITKSANEVHLFHSEDDFVVPYTELTKFARDIPSATIHHFKNKNHFLDATFPELLDLLKQK